jgi:pilus assembly protein CpaB
LSERFFRFCRSLSAVFHLKSQADDVGCRTPVGADTVLAEVSVTTRSAGNSHKVASMFFVGAVVVAGGAIYGIFSILAGYRATAERLARPIETVTVVAASRTLFQGVGITNDDLFVVNLPPDYLPVVRDPESHAIVKVATFASRARIVGQVPRERILANEFIRPERLADGSAGIGLNAVIPRGMRAISVGVHGADAVSGFLTPGNYVDVLVTMRDELNRRRTETILQAVFVLGVDSRAQDEDESEIARGPQAPSVTFLVTPKQAEDMAYADEIGALSLTLRHVQDVDYEELSGVDLQSLLARVAPQVVPSRIRRMGPRSPTPVDDVADPKEERTILHIRGSEVSLEPLQGQEEAE